MISYEDLFRQALRIRMVEEKIESIYHSDKIQSPIHLSNGQEHISVGVTSALKRTDLVFGTYRSHALYLAKGGNLNEMFAELFGKKTGCGKGRAGSMHLCSPSSGMMGASAIVASSMPHAAGAALAAKIKGNGQVVVCFFGEGATSEGIYHETLNFASLHKIPLLLVCENNGFAIFTRKDEICSYEVQEHAMVYGIKAETVKNGMDLVHIAELSRCLVDEIRAGSGPRLIQIMTCRYRRHVGPGADDHLNYRSSEDIAKWEKMDPLLNDIVLRKVYEQSISEEIERALEFAEKSPFPERSELMENVR